MAEPGRLRLVYSADELDVSPGWFCGHCAAGVPQGFVPAPNARVCRRCGLGLLLETRGDGLPAPSDAFLVVDRALTVQALSDRAERLLGLSEEEAIDQPVGELLLPAEAERADRVALARAIMETVSDGEEFAYAWVRPASTYGVRMRARISACGPPRAALVVLRSPGQRLRVV